MKSLKEKKLIFEKIDSDTNIFIDEINWYKEKDVQEAVRRYEILLNTLINIGNFENYEGSKQDVAVEVIDSLLRKYKQIFGDFEE